MYDVWDGPKWGAHDMLVYGTLFFFFYNNIFYKNIEAEIYKILRIFQE